MSPSPSVVAGPPVVPLVRVLRRVLAALALAAAIAGRVAGARQGRDTSPARWVAPTGASGARLSTTVVGDGIVGRRVTRLLSDRGAIVHGPGNAPVDALTPSLSKGDVVVLAVAGEHAPIAAALG